LRPSITRGKISMVSTKPQEAGPVFKKKKKEFAFKNSGPLEPGARGREGVGETTRIPRATKNGRQKPLTSAVGNH